MFLEEYGLRESGLNRLIKASYKLLDLVTYFTAGVQEVRAWTIKRGWKAPQAAGVIHTDFEKGFIKAEVIKLSAYQEFKTEAGCREAGKLAIEGKEYTVEDGDIITARGVTASIDAGLYVVGHLEGEGVRVKIARQMDYPYDWKALEASTAART